MGSPCRDTWLYCRHRYSGTHSTLREHCNILIDFLFYKVRFIFSPDPELSGGKGAITGIDYSKDFTSYKTFIIQKLDTPYGKALFNLYNQVIFGSATVHSIANDPGDNDESSGIDDTANQFHALSIAHQLTTPSDIEQGTVDTSLPTCSNAEYRIASVGPSQQHSIGSEAPVAQEQPLSTTHQALLVTSETRTGGKSKKGKGKAREEATVQEVVAAPVVGTRKPPRKARTRNT